MRAWALVENGKDLQAIDLPTPEPKGTEILLEVTHCGVCHSDIHIWEGYYDLGGGKRLPLADRGVVLPLAMGHEIVGRVVRLGPEARGVAIGDVRIVYPWLGCGQCEACLAEEDNMCLVSRALGVFQHGGYATHVLAPHPRHLIDPGALDPALAATYACSGVTVYSAVRKALPLAPDRPIVLVGAGGLGLAAIAVLRAIGHRAIVSVDLSAEKRQAALAAGASQVVDGEGEGVTERIVAACGGPAAAIIDFVNGAQTAAFAFAALSKGGKLIQVGLFGGDLNVPLPMMPLRALTLRGSYVGSPKELRELVALAQGGKVPVPITKMRPEQANEALMRLRDGRVTGRVVLTAA
jgi:alcohol dehydrogenase/propanol-preferring alcohol dehydrogenase